MKNRYDHIFIVMNHTRVRLERILEEFDHLSESYFNQLPLTDFLSACRLIIGAFILCFGHIYHDFAFRFRRIVACLKEVSQYET